MYLINWAEYYVPQLTFSSNNPDVISIYNLIYLNSQVTIIDTICVVLLTTFDIK